MRGIVFLFSLFAFGVAYGSTSFVLPAPIEPGMETSAVLLLPEMTSNKTQRLTIVSVANEWNDFYGIARFEFRAYHYRRKNDIILTLFDGGKMS